MVQSLQSVFRTGPQLGRLLIGSLCVVAVSCGSSRQANSQAAKTREALSATEVFHLRSECAALAEKILAGNVVGVALTQTSSSNYDELTNRCYVELDVHTADLQHFDDYNSRYLYDGQTAQMLAFTTAEKGQKRASIFVPFDSKDSTGDQFVDTNRMIDTFMEDNRGRGRS